MRRSLHVISVLIVLAALLSGCTSTAAPVATALPVPPIAPPTALPVATVPPALPTAQPFALTSSAFEADSLIPARYSCHGANVSPPLAWSAPPAGTQSLALVMEDPDAVKVVGSVWDHWLLFNLPADVLSVPEGVPQKSELPDGSRQGQNSGRGLGYGGPCPPGGQTHGYRFTVYAVDTALALKSGATKAEILHAIDGHILAQAQLVGRYASP